MVGISHCGWFGACRNGLGRGGWLRSFCLYPLSFLQTIAECPYQLNQFLGIGFFCCSLCYVAPVRRLRQSRIRVRGHSCVSTGSLQEICSSAARIIYPHATLQAPKCAIRSALWASTFTPQPGSSFFPRATC